MNTKKVIDGDNMKELESFDSENTESILTKYKELGKWEDVSLDIDGDIILYETKD